MASEHDIQVRLMTMLARMEAAQGHKWLRTATMGGVRLPIGLAMKVKRAGYVKGIPDILLFEPSADGQYIGLAIELKTEKGRASAEQLEWCRELQERGWKATVSKGFDATAQLIADYFDVEIPPHS